MASPHTAGASHERALFAPHPSNQDSSSVEKQVVKNTAGGSSAPAPPPNAQYRWVPLATVVPPSASRCVPSDQSPRRHPESCSETATGAPSQTAATVRKTGSSPSPAPPRSLLRPDDLCDADFRRETYLGEGSYSIVTLATHVPSGHVFALKEIMCGRLRAMHVSEQLQWEINVHRRLRHPNIVRLYSYYYTPEDDHVRLVLEYCPQGTLQQYLRGAPHGRLDEGRASRLARHIARAVAYMHSHKLVHRDLKLENILLDRRGVAKLADFGWSRQLVCAGPAGRKRDRDTADGDDAKGEREHPGATPPPRALADAAAGEGYRTPQTRLHNPDATPNALGTDHDHDGGGATVGRSTVCGTLDYLSPEMVLHRPHTRKTDVWSLGVMIAEMLTGRPPFYRPTLEDTMEAIRTVEPDLSVASDDATETALSPEAASLIKAMLQKEPSERPTMEEVLAHPWLKKRCARSH